MLIDLEQVAKIRNKNVRRALQHLQETLNGWGFAITLVCPEDHTELLINYKFAAFFCPQCKKKWRIKDLSEKPELPTELDVAEEIRQVKARNAAKAS